MTDRIMRVILSLILVPLVLLVGWCSAGVVVAARANAECLRYGYASERVAWNYAAYCIKRVDQTDVVVRLDSIKGAK